MDEYAAWKNFVETGRVSDYLDYCRIKLGYPMPEDRKKPEEYYENGNGRSCADGTDDR